MILQTQETYQQIEYLVAVISKEKYMDAILTDMRGTRRKKNQEDAGITEISDM